MGREVAQPIIGLAPQATCRHGRVTSNVRRRSASTLLARFGAFRMHPKKEPLLPFGGPAVSAATELVPRLRPAACASLRIARSLKRLPRPAVPGWHGSAGAAVLCLRAGPASAASAAFCCFRFVGATPNSPVKATSTSCAPGPRGSQVLSSTSRPWRSAGGRALPLR